jgi:CNT family concentrative nucleoside transporter
MRCLLILLGLLWLPGAAAAEPTRLVPTGLIGVTPVHIDPARADGPGSTDTARATETAAGAAPASVAPPAKIAIPKDIEVPLSGRLMSLVGMLFLLGVAWAMSSNRRKIPWRLVIWGLGLQFVFGLLLLRSDTGRAVFDSIKDGVNRLLGFTMEGVRFLFGPLLDQGLVIALHVLTTIIFFSALLAVLYHLKIMHFVVGGIARLMQKTLGTSGAESLSAAGNIFVGQTEAPLLIRPFVKDMTKSELMCVMVGGFATVAGGVFAAYVGIFQDSFPDIGGHILTASVMSAPAALLIAKLLMPEDGVPLTAGKVARMEKSEYSNVVEAAAKGAADGLMLMLNVAAMLLAFIALVAMLNFLLQMVFGWFGFEGITLNFLLGKALAPVAWLMGVPWQDAETVGALFGTKTVLNEFVAYLDLAKVIHELEPRSVVIATYALCGFANFGSIAIQIGGIGTLAPERRGDLARLGMKAMIGGTLAAFMTGTIAGIIL